MTITILIINKPVWFPKTKDSCQGTRKNPMLSWAEHGTETNVFYRLETFQYQSMSCQIITITQALKM